MSRITLVLALLCVVVVAVNAQTRCGKNQEYKLCHCDKTCAAPYETCVTCTKGCFCIDDHYRNSKNACVPRSGCP